MDLSNLKDVEGRTGGGVLPLGWHTVKVVEAEDGKSSGGHDEFRLRFENSSGGIRAWEQITEKRAPWIKGMIEAMGVDFDQIDASNFSAESLVGRSVSIFVGEETGQDGITKRKRVQGYDKPGKGGGSNGSGVPGDTDGFGPRGVADDDDIPF